jgi:hypothetical protein
MLCPDMSPKTIPLHGTLISIYIRYYMGFPKVLLAQEILALDIKILPLPPQGAALPEAPKK